MLLLVALAIAPAGSKSPGQPALSPFFDSTESMVAAVCATCGRRGHSKRMREPNCCNTGGSWQGMCDGGGTHTWSEGHQACNEGSAEDERASETHDAGGSAPGEKKHVSAKDGNAAKHGCAKCGRNGQMAPNCCSSGGAWEGMCDSGGLHTRSEGYQACKYESTTTWLKAEQLNELFLNGVASNSLDEVGLIFHGFDAPTDNYGAPYKPCTTGYCAQFKDWWPSSIINAKQRHTFASTGIIFSPVRFLGDWGPDPRAFA